MVSRGADLYHWTFVLVRLSYLNSATPVQLVWTVNKSCQRDRATVLQTLFFPARRRRRRAGKNREILGELGSR